MMSKNFFLVLGLGSAFALGIACSSSGDGDGTGGSGAEGGSGGDSSGSGGSGGSASGGKGGTSSGSGGSASGSGGSGGAAGGASGGASGKPFGDTVTIDMYPMAVSQAQCDQLWKCCETEAKAVDPMQSKCAAKKRAPLLQSVNGIKMSIMNNKLAFDGAKLAECLNKLAAVACSASQADVDAVRNCGKYFEGKVDNGAVCTIGLECKEGYCGKAAETDTMSKCMPLKDKDATCKTNDECKSGNCMKAMTSDAEGKCADAPAAKPGLCGYLG